MLTFGKKYFPTTTGSRSSNPFARLGVKEQFAWLDNLHTWFIVPALGIIIPHAAGLMNADHFRLPGLLLHYSIFIAIALIIYKGNMFFLHSIRLRLDGSLPYQRIVGVYFLVNIVYSGIISLAALSAWNRFLNDDEPFARPVVITTLIILITVLFINNLYEIFYLQAEKRAREEKLDLLEAAKLQAELQVLSSQIDPHFMYNALTSLSYLLQQKPGEADNYNAMLASLYKYVLKHKCCQFVTLAQELSFCRQYFTIQQLRFGDAVVLQVLGVREQNLHSLSVPPLSIQTLLENALKHNNFSDEKPLLVQVIISDTDVKVINNVQPLAYKKKSTGIGLQNLNKRSLLLTKAPLGIEKTDLQFAVSLPVCKN